MIPKPPTDKNTTDTTDVAERDMDGKLSVHTASWILDECLKKENRANEQVIMFIDSFIRHKHIGQASEEAGIAPSLGYKWRHRKDIATAISKLIDASATKYGFDASEIVERTKEIVDFDPIMLQRPDGSFKSKMHEIPPEARRALKSMTVKNLYKQTEDINGIKSNIIVGELIEYKFYDKLKAAELVGREKKLFKTTTKVEHDVTKNMAQTLLESAKRASERVKTVEVFEVKKDER